MKALSITYKYLLFFFIFSLAVFLSGVGETSRVQLMNTAESDLINQTNMSTDVWSDYQEFKNSYIFTNQPMIDILNFLGYIGFLYLAYYSWAFGRNNPPMSLSDIMTNYNVLIILIIYIAGIIFSYLSNIFVNQLIIVLFNSIYNSVYMYRLLIDFFIGFILFSYFLAWFSNQIKYFDIFQK